MPWGAVVGGIASAYLANQSSSGQAGAMRDATREQIEFAREKYGDQRDLLNELLMQQEPRRRAAQRATRSLSMMAGLDDPGPAPVDFGKGQKLQSLKDKLEETDKHLTTGGGLKTQYQLQREGAGMPTGMERRDEWSDDPIEGSWRDRRVATRQEFVPEETKLNPEFERLEEEIAQLEQERQGGPGAEPGIGEFEGPRDVTEMPGYEFALDQGLESLASSGAARGMQLSGNQMEDITKFGQGHATKFRGQLLDELKTLAGMRPSPQAVGAAAASPVSEAQQVSPLLGQMGQINAAETAGRYGNLGAMMGQIPWGQMFSGGTANTGGGFSSSPQFDSWSNTGFASARNM